MLNTTNQNSLGRAIPSTNPVQRKWPPLLRMLEVYRTYCGEHTIHKKTVMIIYPIQSIESANGKLGTVSLPSNPHGRVGSMRVKANKQDPLTTSRQRMFPLAMVALLAAVFGLNPRARAQDVPPPISGALGQVQSVGTNSTQEGNSMEAIGLTRPECGTFG
jgi:hypothetical protein